MELFDCQHRAPLEQEKWTKEKCRRNQSPAFFNPKTLHKVVIYNLLDKLSCLRTLSITNLKDIHNDSRRMDARLPVVLGLYQLQI